MLLACRAHTPHPSPARPSSTHLPPVGLADALARDALAPQPLAHAQRHVPPQARAPPLVQPAAAAGQARLQRRWREAFTGGPVGGWVGHRPFPIPPSTPPPPPHTHSHRRRHPPLHTATRQMVVMHVAAAGLKGRGHPNRGLGGGDAYCGVTCDSPATGLAAGRPVGRAHDPRLPPTHPPSTSHHITAHPSHAGTVPLQPRPCTLPHAQDNDHLTATHPPPQ